MDNKTKLFYGSCFALITTALSFSLRAGVLAQLESSLGLTGTQLGFINSMWFLGFPISMVIGGLVYHTVGGKKIMQFAFLSHSLGIVLTILAGVFIGGSTYFMLMAATLLIGLGNGCTEAACNPMIADAYEGKEVSKMLNRFHMWFPGGIVIGSLLSQLMGAVNLHWAVQLSVILIPTLAYGYLFMGQEWPKAKVAAAANVGSNFQAMLTPLFLFIFACMALTAISEFGPQQWVELTLAESGAQPMLILALVTGVMAVARYFGGEAVHRLKTTGVLLGSAVLATIGVYLFSVVTGPAAYFVAIIYALGIAYFWPNMIGFVAEYIPKSGALGMSIVGAMGMFSSFIFQPIIGGWIDANRVAAEAAGKSGSELELATGQATLSSMVIFPALLIGLFAILYFWMRNHKIETVEETVAA